MGQAADALTSHVRTRDGSGHGREGVVPSDFEREDVIDHVEADDDVGNDDDLSSTELPPYA